MQIRHRVLKGENDPLNFILCVKNICRPNVKYLPGARCKPLNKFGPYALVVLTANVEIGEFFA